MPENVNTSALSLDSSETSKPVDNRPDMVRVDHVSMVFNMASEQLNSLKEYLIKIARRELFFEGFTALDDISFVVKKGDVFGIIGTNGSGKSTMLKIIAGVLEPTKGHCEINGNIAPLIELGAGFDTELSARENIYLNGALLGYSKDFIDEHFEEIVSFAEVEKFLDMPLENYSSGMVARIAFAIATVIVPEILVVDEVLSVGDFMFQKKCEDRISELIEKHGVTVLIVSHSNEQIARLCNKAIWIEKGHTRMLGDSESICRVYGGLGGRSGSSKAEKMVFDALRESDHFEIPDNTLIKIHGESADGTNVKMALRGRKDTDTHTVIIACGTTHVNAVMANPLGGALGAPIITTKPDELSEAAERLLYDYKPEQIITIDCGRCASKAFEVLHRLPWHPAITAIENNDGNTWDMSMKLYEYGLKRGLWSNEASLIRLDNNPESLVASPFLYDSKCPLFVASNNMDIDVKDFKETLARGSITHLVAFGAEPFDTLDSKIVSQGIAIERIAAGNQAASCFAITAWVYDRMKRARGRVDELCVATLSLAQWPELLACGCYTSQRPSVLLLEDNTNLDSIAQCLQFVRDRKDDLQAIVSIGNQLALGETELQMLCYELEY